MQEVGLESSTASGCAGLEFTKGGLEGAVWAVSGDAESLGFAAIRLCNYGVTGELRPTNRPGPVAESQQHFLWL